MGSSILRRFHFLIIAALLITIAGCSGKSGVRSSSSENTNFGDLRATIRESINEQRRQDEALAIVGKFEASLSSLLRNREQRKVQFLKLYVNYDAARAEFDSFLRESKEVMQRDQEQVLRERNDLIALTTPEEWAQIACARQDVVDHAVPPDYSIVLISLTNSGNE